MAIKDDQYSHILLIVPITAALISLEWISPQPAHRADGWLAFALLTAAFLLTAQMRLRPGQFSPDVQLSLNMLALVVWWNAAFLISFGKQALRHAIFPLFFLLWMVPLPNVIVNSIVLFLQRGSAQAAHLLFALVGVPVTQNGMLIDIPGLTIEVAPECSSIRSSLFLVITVMVIAHLLLRSWWRKALLVAFSLPVSLAKNGLRIFVLGMLGTRVDPAFLTGKLHHEGGIIYFLVALAAMYLLFWILRRGEKREMLTTIGRG